MQTKIFSLSTLESQLRTVSAEIVDLNNAVREQNYGKERKKAMNQLQKVEIEKLMLDSLQSMRSV